MNPEILVIREKDRFSSILTERGFSVINFPVIKTEPLADLSELEKCLAQIETFDGIFITSSKAAEIIAEKLNETKVNFSGKFFVLGKRSDELLKKAGFKTFFSQRATTAEELLDIIPDNELNGKKFLFARGNRSLRVIPERLENIAEVHEVIVYKTIATEDAGNQSDNIKKKLKKAEFAAVCFFSPSGVGGFLERFPSFSQNETKIVVIGKTTAKAAEKHNLRVDFISAKTAAEDFAMELITHLRKEN